MKKNLKFSTKQNLNTYLQIEIKTFFDRQKTPDIFNINRLTKLGGHRLDQFQRPAHYNQVPSGPTHNLFQPGHKMLQK